MIRINRGAEPSGLEALRKAELERLRRVVQEEKRLPTKKDLGDKYRFAAEALWKAQHNKCCYCEMKEQLDYNDVEHFRPKAEANRSPGSTERYGYWWLAWTWKNLLFSCSPCNRSAKGIQFPLEEGSHPLRANEQPPGNEQPLLIDPARIQGTDHIEFIRDLLGNWSPRARDGSRLGDWTIRMCKLDRPALIDLYNSHVDNSVRRVVQKIEKAIAGGDAQEVAKQWHNGLHNLLAPWQPFVGLSFDALNHFIPLAMRSPWNLDLKFPRF